MSKILPNFRAKSWPNSRFVRRFLALSIGHFFSPLQTRRFSVEMVFCWRRVCPPHLTPPHPISMQRRIMSRSNDPRDLCSVATYSVRSRRNVNMPPPAPPHQQRRIMSRSNDPQDLCSVATYNVRSTFKRLNLSTTALHVHSCPLTSFSCCATHPQSTGFQLVHRTNWLCGFRPFRIVQV